MFDWFRPKLRVVFVCTANVCRSPLAEAMLRQRLRLLGLARGIQVSSAGTRVAQPGRSPDPRVKKLAESIGVSLGRIRATQLTPKIVSRSDLVLVMESRHLEEIEALLGGIAVPGNVRLLGAAEGSTTDMDVDIPDPYFGDSEGFRVVFERLDAALGPIVDELKVRSGQASAPG